MLHMFHTYVPRILSGCCVMFAMIFKCFSCFFKYFRSMFQVFHLSFFGCDKVTTNCFQTPSKFSPINLNLQLWPTTCRNMATCSSIELLIVSVSRRLVLSNVHRWKKGALLMRSCSTQWRSSLWKMNLRFAILILSLSAKGP